MIWIRAKREPIQVMLFYSQIYFLGKAEEVIFQASAVKPECAGWKEKRGATKPTASPHLKCVIGG